MRIRTLITINLVLLGFLVVFYLTIAAWAQSEDASKKKDPPSGTTPPALLEAIQQRDSELDQKAELISQREKKLREIEKEIKKMLEKNEKVRQEIENRTRAQSEKEEELLQRLAKVYGSMEPEEASRRIEKIKDSLALEILSRIKPQVVAQILTGMDPGIAARYSEKLSQVKK